MSNDEYSPEAKAELAKPSTSIERTGTDADAAKAWEEAAFKQARRANGLADELRAVRDRINLVLEEDERDK